MKNQTNPDSIQATVVESTRPSSKMIKTLKHCLQIETSFPGKPYGPADLKGSFIGLYKRGLLDINTNSNNKLKPGNWFVTSKGLMLLHNMPDE